MPAMQINQSLICYWTPTSDLHFLLAQPNASVWIMKPLALWSLECGPWLEHRLSTPAVSVPGRPCGQGLSVFAEGRQQRNHCTYILWQLRFIRWPWASERAHTSGGQSTKWIQFGVDDAFNFGNVKMVPWISKFISITRTVFYTYRSLPVSSLFLKPP